jgi:uncharacterized delta-60 repeat protein
MEIIIFVFLLLDLIKKMKNMLKKYLYSLLISGLFFSQISQSSATTPQARCVAGGIASKPRFKNKSNASRSAVKRHHSALFLMEADSSNTYSRARAHATSLGTTSAIGLVDSNSDENITRSLLDLNFNTFGVEPGTNVAGFTGDWASANSVAIDAQGRIVLAGSSSYEDAYYFAVARFSSDGTLDESFADSGIKRFSIINSYESGAYGVAIDSNGLIVVAGGTSSGDGNQFAVARLTPAGDLDTDFNSTGVHYFSIESGQASFAFAVAIDSGDNIVVGGGSGSSIDHFAVARLTPDGNLDTTFNSTGVTSFSIVADQSSFAYAVAIDSYHNIVLGGYAYDGSANYFAAAKLTSSGVLDTDFNTTGKTYFSIISSKHCQAYSIAIDSHNKIVLGGYSLSPDNNSLFAVAKLNVDGTLDTSFNQTGKAYTTINNFTEFESGVYTVAIDLLGNVVLGGYAYVDDGDTYHTAVARFTPSGVLDTTFNSLGAQPGTAVININGNPDDQSSEVFGVAIDSDNKIVVAGYTYFNNNSQKSFSVARFNEIS